MGRAPCCDKSNVKRGPWSPEEDATLKNYLHNNGTAGNWISLPQRAGLRRCGKSCRLRWLNYLRPDIKHGDFSEAEDNTIISMYYKMGSRWSIIASNLPGRTDNDVKNYWNTKLKKKLFAGTSNNNNNKLIPTTINHPNNINTNHVTFTTTTTTNPIFQVSASSSPNHNPNNPDNYDYSTNHFSNQNIYVPNPTFSELLNQCTMATSFAHDPFCIPIPTRNPFHQAAAQASSSAPHEEVSSASGSSSVVYGSGFEDDPFLREFGFGFIQDEGVDQEDIKPPHGVVGQGACG